MRTVDIINTIQEINTIQHNLTLRVHQELSLDIVEYHELSEDGNMMVGGIALTSGRHLSKVDNMIKEGPLYTSDILRQKAETLIGKKIFFDFTTQGKKHNPISDNEVGYITSARYDEEKHGIIWKGVVTAKKIYNQIKEKTIKAVSLGIFAFTKIVDSIPLVEDFLVEELSLVQRGADKNATVDLI